MTAPTLRPWLILGVCLVASGVVLNLTGLSAPYLFAGFIAGATTAMAVRDPPRLPGWIRPAAMGMIGVGAGAMVDSDTLQVVAGAAVPVVAVVIGTIAISVGIGQSLRLYSGVDRSTAIFSSIAGGASGVIVVARDFGADERVVMSVQYLRVLTVLVTLPMVSTLFFGDPGNMPAAQEGPSAGAPAWLFTIATLLVGLALARLLRFTASLMVVPMIVAALAASSGLVANPDVPPTAMSLAYAATGVQVGLGFTRDSMSVVARLMPLALLQVASTIGLCAGLGLLLSVHGDVTPFDGYLATSPGGMPAVTAIAIAADANVGLVLAVQVLRNFMALLLAPLVGRLPPERP